ncbi:MAG: PDZ domain-containing protein [Phycisphaerales bacterium]|nr:PDZ domain-containing protein [Phycisphaerales bacterium]
MKRTHTRTGWLMLSAGTALVLTCGAMGDTPAPSERAAQITRESEAAARAAAALRKREPVGSMSDEAPATSEERRIENATAYTIKVGKDEYWIVVRGSEIDSVKVNGKDAPLERASIQGNALMIYNDAGSVTARVRMGSGISDFPSVSGGVAGAGDAQGRSTRTRVIYPRSASAGAQGGGKGAVAGSPSNNVGQGPSTWVVDTNSDLAERSVMVGVQMVPVEPALVGHFGLEPGVGIMISAVAEGLPAAESGLKPFDIITKIDDKKVESVNALRDVLVSRKAKPGETIKFSIISGGQPREVSIKLAPFEQAQFAGASWKQMPYEPVSMSVSTPTNVTGLFGPGGENENGLVGLGLSREQARRTAELSLKDAQNKFKGITGPVVTTLPQGAEAVGDAAGGVSPQQIMILPDVYGQSQRSMAIEAERMAVLEDRLARMEVMLREMALHQAEAMKRLEKAVGSGGGGGNGGSSTSPAPSSATPATSPKP